MDKKYCLGCNKNIDICLFSLNNKEIDGYQNRCKNCKKIQYYISLSKKDKWYLKFIKEFNLDFINNKNEFLIKIKQFSKWKWENIKQTDDYKLLNKQRREKNKEQVKQNNKKRYKEDILYQNSIKNNVKEWEEKNKKKKNQRRKNRYNNDLDFKLKLNLRNYFNISLKTIPKKSSILDLIGCSVEDLKLHLENQFLN